MVVDSYPPSHWSYSLSRERRNHLRLICSQIGQEARLRVRYLGQRSLQPVEVIKLIECKTLVSLNDGMAYLKMEF